MVLIMTREVVSDFTVVFEVYTWAKAFKMTGELRQRASALPCFGGLDERLRECKSVGERARCHAPGIVLYTY